MKQEFITLATRNGFNRALRHFGNTLALNDAFEAGKGFAGTLVDLYEQGKLEENQLLPILNAILVSKFDSAFASRNLTNGFDDFPKLQAAVKKWSALDLTLVYHSPALGTKVIDPKNLKHLEDAQDFGAGHLVVAYSYAFNKDAPKNLAKEGAEALISIIEGADTVNTEWEKFIDKDREQRLAKKIAVEEAAKRAQGTPKPAAKPAPAPTPAAAPAQGAAPATKPKGKKTATPKYAVQVSNELFHNGNVEAWKNIIESYQTKFPHNKVIVFYEGELIQDLNSLFKWGKVKHAGLIFIQVIGYEIRGVSKLQKYLYEGASPRYKAFLKQDINKVLRLF